MKWNRRGNDQWNNPNDGSMGNGAVGIVDIKGFKEKIKANSFVMADCGYFVSFGGHSGRQFDKNWNNTGCMILNGVPYRQHDTLKVIVSLSKQDSYMRYIFTKLMSRLRNLTILWRFSLLKLCGSSNKYAHDVN